MMKLMLSSLLSLGYGQESSWETQGAALLQVRGDLARGTVEEEREPDVAALEEQHLRARSEEEAMVAAAMATQDEDSVWNFSSNCSTCQNCLIGGTCYDQGPDGETPTEALCLKHWGTWCPTGKSPPKVFVVPPCISGADFKKDAFMDGFGKNGSVTCGEALKKCGAACAVFNDAKKAGSCKNLTFQGKPLTPMVRGIAKMCCASAPKNLCEPNAKLPTPCADDADFDKDAMFAESGLSCGMAAMTWKDMRMAMLEAKKAGSCDNITVGSTRMARAVGIFAKRCCMQFPLKTKCNPSGKIMASTCQNNDDFNMSAPFWGSYSCGDWLSSADPKMLKSKNCKKYPNLWWPSSKCCSGPGVCA